MNGTDWGDGWATVLVMAADDPAEEEAFAAAVATIPRRRVDSDGAFYAAVLRTNHAEELEAARLATAAGPPERSR